MNAAPGSPDARYRSLDHWRGFAALWVMVFHTVNTWLVVRPDFLPPGLAHFCAHGWLGANLFFVISGYCIAERTAREYLGGGSVRRFTLDRLLRIYPPYWAALVFALAVNVTAAFFNGGQAAGLDSPWPGGWGEWLKSTLALEHWFGQPSYLLVAWTLAYEIGFYLLTALCLGLALGTKRPWTGYALGGVLFVAGLVPAIGSRVPLLALWPHFALGSLVWLLFRQLPQVSRRIVWGSTLLAVLALVTWTLPAEPRFTLWFVTACAWLLLLLQPFDARLAALPALRWLGWIGTFSYSLYLIHAPVVGKFRNLLSRWWQPGDPGALWVCVAAGGLAIMASWGFYRLVELRTERWRRAYSRHRVTP